MLVLVGAVHWHCCFAAWVGWFCWWCVGGDGVASGAQCGDFVNWQDWCWWGCWLLAHVAVGVPENVAIGVDGGGITAFFVAPKWLRASVICVGLLVAGLEVGGGLMVVVVALGGLSVVVVSGAGGSVGTLRGFGGSCWSWLAALTGRRMLEGTDDVVGGGFDDVNRSGGWHGDFGGCWNNRIGCIAR